MWLSLCAPQKSIARLRITERMNPSCQGERKPDIGVRSPRVVCNTNCDVLHLLAFDGTGRSLEQRATAAAGGIQHVSVFRPPPKQMVDSAAVGTTNPEVEEEDKPSFVPRSGPRGLLSHKDGTCGLCGRSQVPVTSHHLIPKCTHKEVSELGLFSPWECESRRAILCS